MQFSKLQYITDSPQMAEEACRAGVKWVQARVKNRSQDETRAIVRDIISVCRKHNALCIVNDHLEIALEENADGVHLGKEDLSIEHAKKLIGKRNFILGGTANTIDDVKKLCASNVNYIGLGPFRFTTTKEKLAPVLGEAGYSKIMAQLMSEQTQFPAIYAIGGILSNDVQAIIRTGIYGVAVSGVITHSADKRKTVDDFLRSLNENVHANK